MEWIIHLDTDELLYPGGAAEYSLRRLLDDVPHDVDMVIFPNYVSKGKSRIKYCTVIYMSGCLQSSKC
jgi:hypothetical protein